MNTFDIIGLDPLELNGKPATIQTIIDALWSDDYHEQQPMTGAPEVCLCELCQSLVPALEQVDRENAALRERVDDWLFEKMGEARIADLHFDYGNRMIGAFDFDGELVAEAETLARVFELATAEGGEFSEAANRLLHTKSDLWQKMADEGGE